MSAISNSSVSNTGSSTLDSKTLELSKSSKNWELKCEEELRIECVSEYKIELTLTKGSAEIFGTELRLFCVG